MFGPMLRCISCKYRMCSGCGFPIRINFIGSAAIALTRFSWFLRPSIPATHRTDPWFRKRESTVTPPPNPSKRRLSTAFGTTTVGTALASRGIFASDARHLRKREFGRRAEHKRNNARCRCCHPPVSNLTVPRCSSLFATPRPMTFKYSSFERGILNEPILRQVRFCPVDRIRCCLDI